MKACTTSRIIMPIAVILGMYSNAVGGDKVA
jgi:hypothetical protein